MNSEEGVSLAKMAVTVLLVVLVIGAVVAIVYKAYSWFNSGSDKLGDQVTSIGSSAYSQYDDVLVKGTDVLTALKSYRNADFGVVIANIQNLGTAYTPSNPSFSNGTQGCNYCGIVAAASGNFANKVPDMDANALYRVTISAVAANADAAPTGQQIVYEPKTSRYWCDNLHFTSGIADKNTNFSPTTDASITDAFVKQTGTFYSKLIYSKDTGDVCGVIFLQVE